MNKCTICESEIEEDYTYFNTKGEEICETCESESWNDSVIIHVYEAGEYHKVYYNTVLDMHMNPERGDYNGGCPDPIQNAGWVTTGGYRGYMGTTLDQQHIEIADGWATGDFDDVAWKRLFHRFTEDLAEGNIYTTFPVYIVATQTSNVFSTAISVAIPRGKKLAFRKALKFAGYTIEDIENALR
jgi:hypothetical protein